jgi:acyl-CoA dehydrogenase
MDFELSDEHRMLKDLVARFVKDELMPLEGKVLEREALGQGTHLIKAERARIDKVTQDLGLWGLDAPEEMGGHDLPVVAMIGVNEEMGKTVTPYTWPPPATRTSGRRIWRPMRVAKPFPRSPFPSPAPALIPPA